MKSSLVVLAGVLVCANAGAVMAAASRSQPATAPATSPAPISGPAAETGYSVGFDIGREVKKNLTSDGVNADIDAVVRGFGDALRGTKPALSDDQMARILTELQAKVDDARNSKLMESDPAFKASASAAAAMSKAFMEKFAQLDGVQTLPGGICYIVKKTGSGEAVGDARAVVVNYQAFLTRRQMVADKQGAEVVITGMVPGAQAVIRKMKVGDRWYVAIPPEQGFGSRGHEPGIGPNEALIVDVEIVEVKK